MCFVSAKYWAIKLPLLAVRSALHLVSCFIQYCWSLSTPSSSFASLLFVQVVPASFKSYLSTKRFGVKFYRCGSVLTQLKNCSRKKLSTKNSSTTEPVTNNLNCLANAWLTCPSTLPNSRRTSDCKRSVKASTRSKELVPAAILSKRQSFSSRFHDASENHFME